MAVETGSGLGIVGVFTAAAAQGHGLCPLCDAWCLPERFAYDTARGRKTQRAGEASVVDLYKS